MRRWTSAAATMADAEAIRQIYNLEVTRLDSDARPRPAHCRGAGDLDGGPFRRLSGRSSPTTTARWSASPRSPLTGPAPATRPPSRTRSTSRPTPRQGGRAGAAQRGRRHGPDPRLSLRRRPRRRRPGRPRSRSIKLAVSTSSASSVRSAASSAAGSTSPSCSACSEGRHDRPACGRGWHASRALGGETARTRSLSGVLQRPADPDHEGDGKQRRHGDRGRSDQDRDSPRRTAATSFRAPGRPKKARDARQHDHKDPEAVLGDRGENHDCPGEVPGLHRGSEQHDGEEGQAHRPHRVGPVDAPQQAHGDGDRRRADRGLSTREKKRLVVAEPDALSQASQPKGRRRSAGSIQDLTVPGLLSADTHPQPRPTICETAVITATAEAGRDAASV